MAGGTQVRQMFMEMASVSFVWKMTYKWRQVPAAAAATSGPSACPTQSKLLRKDAAAQVTGCRRPSGAAWKASSDEVTAVPKEETATNKHQR